MAHFSFTESWPERAKHELLDVARRAIVHAVVRAERLAVNIEDFSDELQAQGACFVTILYLGQLRGCIGSLEPRRALVLDITDNAYAACLRDPRFPPVQEIELRDISAEISVLSPLQRIEVDSEKTLINTLRPFHDGLVIDDGYHRATFLPSVWEQLPEAKQFVAHLKTKAGMSRGYWSENMKCFIYTTAKFHLPNLI